MPNPLSLFRSKLVQKPSAVGLTDTSTPAFAGISSLVANANGSLTASWTAATGTKPNFRYRIYINTSNVPATLFSGPSIPFVSRNSATSVVIYTDALDVPLQKGVTYYVGVRAIDSLSFADTNTVILSAISQGVADNSNDAKLNQIIAALGTPVTSVSADIASVKADSATLVTRLTAGRASNLDNLDVAVSTRSTQTDMTTLVTRLTSSRAANLDKIDVVVSTRASQTSVDSIQNNTSFVGQVQTPLILPASGSKTYKFYARLFNEIGQPADPDGNVMNARIETTGGTVIVATFAMNRSGVGLYDMVYTVNATDPERPLVVFFEYTRSGISFQHARTTEVQEFETKLDTLLGLLTPTRASNLDNLDALVSTRSTQADMTTLLGRLTSGRASNLDNLDMQLTVAYDAVQLIKAKTDQLGFTSGNVNADAKVVSDKTGYALTSGQISTIVADVWDALIANHTTSGTMGRALSDAAYSGTGITPIDLQNIANYIWDEPRSMHSNPNSFGESNQGVISGARAAKIDNLDVALSTRASQSSVNILSQFTPQRIQNLDFLDAAISNLATAAAVASVKADTTRIPADPATEGSVHAIPTNPVLANDSRLSALDAPISSRAQVSDLAPLATNANLASGFGAIGTVLGSIVSDLGTKATPADIASAVAPLATAAAVANVSSAVAAVAAAQIAVGDIWSYGVRTLTDAVDVNLSLAGVATTADVESARDAVIDQTADWKPRLTAAINPQTDTMEIISWLTRNEVVVLDASECSVDITDGDNQIVLAVGPDLMIESNGVFKFTRLNASVVLQRNKTYTCIVKIIRNAVEYSGIVPITVF